MSTKPTAAESAKWHREQAQRERMAELSMRQVARANPAYHHDADDLARNAAHHEAAAEALDLLAEIERAHPVGLRDLLSDEHHTRLLALVEGR